MKPAAIFLTAVFFLSPLLPVHAQGLFSRFRKDDKNKVLSGEELAQREGAAAQSFEKARSLEAEGKTGKAHDIYKSIARSYPNTKMGGEAQFRVAQIYDADGNGKKAFDEYKALITTYRSSPHFKTAIERQFAIAESLRTDGKKGLFGIGATAQPSDLKKMYEQIADAAPYTHFAPRSLMAMGEIDLELEDKPAAIRNYQEVVDNYRSTPFAKDAQFKIYEIRGDAARMSNSPSEDRAQVEAGLNFVANNPEDTRAEEVKAGLERIEQRSLEKMYKTGQFYEESGNHKSALVYYREIAKKPNSPLYGEAVARMNRIEKILAGEEVEEKANRFGSLPKLPKIEAPKFRIGKRDDVEPLPPAETQPTTLPGGEAVLVPNDPVTAPE